MAFDKLTGLYEYPDFDFIIRRLTGLQAQYLENLSIRVQDQFGNSFPNVTIQITKDGGSPETILLANGEYFEEVLTETEFEVQVLDGDTYLVVDGSATETVPAYPENKAIILEVRKSYWYKARRKKGSQLGEYTEPVRLALE